MRCHFCLRKIMEKFDETVHYKLAGKETKRVVHLSCYLEKIFTRPVERTIQPTDAVLIVPTGVCQWCRKSAPVAEMPRSGQGICLSCTKAVDDFLEKWYQDNQGVAMR